MNTAIPAPEPDDVSSGLAQLELYAQQTGPQAAPWTLVPVPVDQGDDDAEAIEDDGQALELVDLDDDAEAPAVSGETRRVKQLRARVAEAHALADLQDDDTEIYLESAKVRRLRARATEAARLHQLAQDPAMRAYQATRTRRLLLGAAGVSFTLAAVWSTAGVQKFAATGTTPYSPAWWGAWAVEPCLSLGLLVVVGARAYLSVNGLSLKDKVLFRIEVMFLALSLGMNVWPYLPGVAAKFAVAPLVLHLLGPAVMVAIVLALPRILSGFNSLDLGEVDLSPASARTGARRGTGTPRTGAPYRANADLDALTERARQMIESGELAPTAGVHKFRVALGPGVGTDTARTVRAQFAGGEA